MSASLVEPASSREAADMLLALLDVEEVSALRWRGQRRPGGVGRIFGGQVIAQALAAAQRSLTDQRLVHSLHAYFLRGGDADHPIRSEEHTSELQSLMRISYAVFCLKKIKKQVKKYTINLTSNTKR